jgi:hypothetical protein
VDDRLAEIATATTPCAQAVLFMDDAGWHNCKHVTILDNISLLRLPAYALDPNPVELTHPFSCRESLM